MVYKCRECGHQDHADRNASVNIAKRGLRQCNHHVPALKSLPGVRKVRRRESGSVNLPTSACIGGDPADDDTSVFSRTEGSRAVVHNPLGRMEKRFGWDRPEWDNPTLDRADVRALYQAAENLEERLLVVGLAGWGLRASELCALRAEQVVLGHENGEYPYIKFGEGERKNGPGTVALLVGVSELTDRIDVLAENPGWSGYLFSSTTAASGHVVTDTMRNRFASLAERAGNRRR